MLDPATRQPRRVGGVGARTRALLWQTGAVAAVTVVVGAIACQAAANLKARGIASGFDYLGRPAAFEIARGVIDYSSGDTLARALVVGLVNTLRVSVLGIVITTVLGTVVGLARLSRIWIVARTAGVYVEVFRNTPLLLQLLFWYALAQALPPPQHALRPAPGVFLTFRGLFLPAVVWRPGGPGLSLPQPAGFGFQGGTSISPEFAALLVGLSVFTAAFLAEIVRGGILAVDRGQSEAAAALGLSRVGALRFIVLPQALRVIVPPATSQFLNLAKNSSLGVAIGYPELIAITTATLNQTGQAIEALTIAMAVYLAISLVISLAMNHWNRTLVGS